MVSIQGGPFGISLAVAALLAIGFGLAYGLMWLGYWRRHRSVMVHRTEVLTKLVDETRRLLAQDERAVNTFIHDFGGDLFDHFAGEDWIKQVTLHDLRNHVECAVFDLVQGCHCGNCSGFSDGGPFWVEAVYGPNGLAIRGVIAKEVIRVEVACAPQRTRVDEHHENVTMVCETCKTTPVVTSIDHIAQGKRPTCASCIGAASA